MASRVRHLATFCPVRHEVVPHANLRSPNAAVRRYRAAMSFIRSLVS